MASIDRRPNGTYRARWREHPGGPQRTKTFRRRVDAERFLVSVQHALYSGAYVDPARSRTTLEDWWPIWSARQPWRPSTLDRATSAWRFHIAPAFGRRQLGSLRRGEVEDWARSLNVAPSTAGSIVQTLGALLEGAVVDGLLAVNPAARAKRPKVERLPVVPPTVADVEALTAAAPPWFAVAVTLGAMAGLRQGEATGLTLDRALLLRRELRVDRQLLSPVAQPTVLGPPKTKRSVRTVPLADTAVERIARHVEQHGTGTHGVIVHRDGQPLRRQRLSAVWRDTVAAAGLPIGTRFHDLRHFYASVLLDGGVGVPAAAEYLGHSPAILLSTYGHLMPSSATVARSVVQRAFDVAEDSLRTDRG